MQEGNTFLFPGASDDHLWMIISDPQKDGDHVVIVRFLSFREDLEDTFIAKAGDHPFVKHDTIVDFGDARLVPDAKLEELRKSKRLKPMKDLSPKLLADIREAVPRSRIPLKCEKALEDQGLLP